MKTTSFFAGMLVLLSSATFVQAQSMEETTIRILPVAERGKLKLVYARDSKTTVTVSFIGNEGLVKSDRIRPGSFDKGFIKKYDVSHLRDENFWIEVSSADLMVRYRMVKSADGKSYVPHLEQTIYNHPMVATIN